MTELQIPAHVFVPKYAVCKLHAEPLRPKWPHGYVQVVTECYKILQPTMYEFEVPDQPMCCRVGEPNIIRILKDIPGLFDIATCKSCLLTKPSCFSFMEQTSFPNIQIKMGYICLSCWLEKGYRIIRDEAISSENETSPPHSEQ